MALRGAGEVGVPDVRRFSDLLVTESENDQREPVVSNPSEAAPDDPTAGPARNTRRQPALAAVPAASTAAQVSSAITSEPVHGASMLDPASPRALLGDERQVYLQADVPEVALQRVKTVSFELAAEHRHLSRHQTILGALVWNYVDHTDQTKLDLLADLLDAYRVEGWHGLPEVRRLSGRVPATLKRRMEGSVLALEYTHRDASAKVLLAALVWRQVVSSDANEAGFAHLVDILGGYQQEVSQRSLTAPLASTRPV